mgnify:CR=1 FL=1
MNLNEIKAVVLQSFAKSQVKQFGDLRKKATWEAALASIVAEFNAELAKASGALKVAMQRTDEALQAMKDRFYAEVDAAIARTEATVAKLEAAKADAADTVAMAGELVANADILTTLETIYLNTAWIIGFLIGVPVGIYKEFKQYKELKVIRDRVASEGPILSLKSPMLSGAVCIAG